MVEARGSVLGGWGVRREQAPDRGSRVGIALGGGAQIPDSGFRIDQDRVRRGSQIPDSKFRIPDRAGDGAILTPGSCLLTPGS